MAKLKIMSMELAAPKSRKEEVISYLQKKGVIELSHPQESDYFGFTEYSKEIAENQKKLSVIMTAGDILSKAVAVKKPLTAMLEPRKDITEAEYLLMSKEVDNIYDTCNEIIALDKSIASLKADCLKYETLIEELKPWQGIDIPLKSGNTKHTAFVLGMFRKQYTKKDIDEILKNELPEIDCIETKIISSDENQTCIVFFTIKDALEETENVLRSIGFIRAPECPDKTPFEAIGELEEKIKEAKSKQEDCFKNICNKSVFLDRIDFAKDFLTIYSQKLQGMENIPESKRMIYITGYIAKKDAEKTADYVKNKFDAAMIVKEPDEDEDVPVLLSNNFFAAPLEGITGMYSMPGKFDPDPTGIMAFFYYFFFGMMLSDAGYGLLMVLATGGILLAKKNLEKKMKNMLLMYFFCGISTMFWGAMYGSWFGDMINVIRTEFLNLPEIRLYIWMEPVKSLMELLVYCFLFGLVHLFVGVAVKAVSNWKNGDKIGAICDSVPTYLTILGIAPIFFGLFTEVPEILSKIGTPVLLVGVILVILTAGRHSKSIGGKIGGGLYEVYNLVGGYLGDVLSYARLLALGLSTGVIAEVMNMLGVLPSNKILKLVMFIIVAIVGHLANFAINVIGAYVHTNRLQYVEFFGKFYEGGGRAFVPFEAKTQYYKFKEEN